MRAFLFLLMYSFVFISISFVCVFFRSIDQQPYQSAQTQHGEGAQLLEVEGREGGEADDATLPVDEVLRGGEA